MSIFTDDEPDFFLDGEETEPEVTQRPSAPVNTRPNSDINPAPAPRIIEFASSDSNEHHECDTDYDEDNDESDDYFLSSGSTPKAAKRSSRHLTRYIVATSLIIILGAIAYLRYFTPYVSDRRIKVYVTAVEKRGLIFPTSEARIVELDHLTDSQRPYVPTSEVSVATPAVAEAMERAAATHTPVTIVCNLYHGSLPWRGSSLTIVTGVE